MAVIPEVDVNARIGTLPDSYNIGFDRQQSLMDRSHERGLTRRDESRKEAEYAVMQPILAAKHQAEFATATATLTNAKHMEELKTRAATESVQAAKDFTEANQLPDFSKKASALAEVQAKYSWLTMIPEYKGFVETVNNARAEAHMSAMADAKLKEQMEMTKARLAGPDSPLGKMLGDYDVALKSGDVEKSRWIKQGIENEITPKGMSLEVGPDGSIRLNQGGGAGLTTTNTTKSQERQYQQERLIREGGQLLNILRPEDLGVQGNIGETAGGFLGQLDPEMAKAQVAENRTRLRTFRESALRAVSDDARFSNQDRKAIEQMLPSDGWVENLPQAKAKLKAVITIFAERAQNEAKRQGKQSWTQATPEELVKAARDGKIDKDAAAAILEALHPEWVAEQSGKK